MALFVVLVLAVGLIAARLALPFYLRDYVNRTLDQSPEYDGQVGEIDVHLFRGAYTIHDVRVVKTRRSVPVPFFEAERMDLALDWRALLQGRARGKINLERPRLNFVHGRSREETQTGVAGPWLKMIDDLYPFRIDKAEVHEGEIHFRAFHTTPEVDVYLTGVNGELTNLTNVQDSTEPLVATIHATGTAMESGLFEFDMSLDPQAHRPTFNLATRLLDLDIRQVNALSLAYGNFDFESGRFDLVVEASVKDGFLEGYAKPLFRNAQVISVRDLETKDPLRVLWEALVSAVGEVFTNQSREQFGTRITLQGDLDNPQTSLLEIVGNVLYNAFVQAFLPQVEGRYAPDVARPVRAARTPEGGNDSNTPERPRSPHKEPP